MISGQRNDFREKSYKAVPLSVRNITPSVQEAMSAYFAHHPSLEMVETIGW